MKALQFVFSCRQICFPLTKMYKHLRTSAAECKREKKFLTDRNSLYLTVVDLIFRKPVHFKHALFSWSRETRD